MRDVTGIPNIDPSVVINAIFAWFVHQFFQLDALTAGAALLLTSAALLAARQMRARSRRLATLETGIASLRVEHEAVKTALDATKRDVAEVTLAIAQKSESRERRIAAELKSLEGLVRDFAAKTSVRAVPQPRPAAPRPLAREPSRADSAMLEIIRRALEDNRVDLFLQPIVSLPQRKVRFFEALSRLRSEDGQIVMPAQFVKVAAPAGLMSVVDNLLLLRCIQMVRRLGQKNRDIAVFCNISAHTLADADFPQLLDFLHRNRDLKDQIVFEFAQSAVLKAGTSEEANLRYLSGLGFKLSMDQVTALDADFARARRLGFQFVKVGADMLISGMTDARSALAAEDLKDLLARNGLSLIVERIENEKTVVQLLEFNVDFGQGYLFGEPKPIREDKPIREEAGAVPAPALAAEPVTNVMALRKGAAALVRRAG